MIVGATNDDDLFQNLSDFFESGAWDFVRVLFIGIAVLFWLAVAYWVFKDARRRIESPWLVGLATLVGLVPPFLGMLVYLLFRPPEYLEDVRERELEIKAMEESLAARELRCPVCRANVGAAFLICPVCTTRIKQACESCKAPLEPLWQVCPYCETPVEATGPIEVPAERPLPRRRRSQERQ